MNWGTRRIRKFSQTGTHSQRTWTIYTHLDDNVPTFCTGDFFPPPNTLPPAYEGAPSSQNSIGHFSTSVPYGCPQHLSIALTLSENSSQKETSPHPAEGSPPRDVFSTPLLLLPPRPSPPFPTTCMLATCSWAPRLCSCACRPWSRRCLVGVAYSLAKAGFLLGTWMLLGGG